jgi:hypothetical protein
LLSSVLQEIKCCAVQAAAAAAVAVDAEFAVDVLKVLWQSSGVTVVADG